MTLNFDMNEEKLLEKLRSSDNMYYGVTTGRVAGRISNAKFKMQDKEYNLEKNNGDACLHGGKTGWDKVKWNGLRVVNVHRRDLGMLNE